MNRDTYNNATVALDRVLKFQAIKDKIKREFPEFEYDKQSKIVGDKIFAVLDKEIEEEQKYFDEL